MIDCSRKERSCTRRERLGICARFEGRRCKNEQDRWMVEREVVERLSQVRDERGEMQLSHGVVRRLFT